MTLEEKKLWCRSTLVEEMMELHDSHIGGKLGEENGAAAVGVGVTIECIKQLVELISSFHIRQQRLSFPFIVSDLVLMLYLFEPFCHHL